MRHRRQNPDSAGHTYRRILRCIDQDRKARYAKSRSWYPIAGPRDGGAPGAERHVRSGYLVEPRLQLRGPWFVSNQGGRLK